MKKRYVFCLVLALLSLIILSVPLINRIEYENKNNSFSAAVDYNQIKEIFGGECLDVLKDYKESGAKSVVIERKDGKFDENAILSAKNMGFEIALSFDADSSFLESDARDLCSLLEKYGIRFLNPRAAEDNPTDETMETIAQFLKTSDTVLLLTENKNQLSNENFYKKDLLLSAADGRNMRVYETGEDAFLKDSDYALTYHKMLNSAYGRNTKFIKISQQNKTDDIYENAKFTQKNISLFCKKMQSLGYRQDNFADFKGYNVSNRTAYAAMAVLIALMCAYILNFILKKHENFVFTLCALFEALLIFGACILPVSAIMNYSTLFAALAPCFLLTLAFSFADAKKDEFSFIKLFGSCAAIVITASFLCCLVCAAILGGNLYYVNEYVFRGVKICLVLPVIYSVFVLYVKERNALSFGSLKKIKLRNAAVLVLLLLVAGVYVVRSGNTKISAFETYLRNLLSDILIARPRTKEILIGFPAFMGFVYFSKNKNTLFKGVCAMGTAVLLASQINTFCHSFASAGSMCLRFLNGVWIGILVLILILAIYWALKKSGFKGKRCR